MDKNIVNILKLKSPFIEKTIFESCKIKKKVVEKDEREKNLRKIINKYKIPFALTWNASDLIESDHKYYIGRPGAFAERGTNYIIQNF